MKPYVTVGLSVLAGVALFEMALVPGILIGGAAVLAPRYLPKGYLPKLRRRLQPLSERTVHRRAATAAASLPEAPGIGTAQYPLPKFAIGRAVAKTITFRIIVTTLDFSTNYLVIGEFATAAGLSTYNLIAGPLFYLGHEAAWNYFGASEAAVDLAALAPMAAAANARPGILGGLTISRALAKTITFRTIASAMDFATNYFVVRDVGQALILSASGFVLGPFVYFGHEKAWEYFSPSTEHPVDPASAPQLLPAPV
ncbi:MAG: DUF2061 domain-containing protein [Xanthobacteraceae bacterium]